MPGVRRAREQRAADVATSRPSAAARNAWLGPSANGGRVVPHQRPSTASGSMPAAASAAVAGLPREGEGVLVGRAHGDLAPAPARPQAAPTSAAASRSAGAAAPTARIRTGVLTRRLPSVAPMIRASPAASPRNHRSLSGPLGLPLGLVAVGRDLPTGVVTFLLTDIESSTSLWEAQPDAMADGARPPRQLIAEVVDRADGRLIKSQGEGDATLSVFPRASDAVLAALRIRSGILAEPWPAELGAAGRGSRSTPARRSSATATTTARPSTGPPGCGRSLPADRCS